MLTPQLDRADVEIQREQICFWETARHICGFGESGQGQLTMSDKPENEDSTAEAAVSTGTPKPGLKVFPLLLIILAVFPIALGIGFAMQSGPPVARLAASDEVVPPVPNRIKPVTSDEHSLAQNRANGDELFCLGRYEAALHLYKSLGSTDSLRLPPELILRIGMCQEGLGLWDESLASYRSVASAHSENLKTSAILGQGRVWMRLNDFEAAEPLLRSLVLQTGDPHRVPPDAVHEIVLLHAICLAELSLVDGDIGISAGLAAVGLEFDWSLAQALHRVDARQELTAAVVPDRLLDVECSQEIPQTEDDIPPEIIPPVDPLANRLTVRAEAQSAFDILDLIGKETGLPLVWSDAARERAASRMINTSLHEMPLVLVLSVLCREFAGEWNLNLQQRSISVDTAKMAGSGGRQREIGTACLIGAMARYPNPSFSDAAIFARAQIATADGCSEDAAILYSSLIGHSTSPLAIRSAFNAALAYHHCGDLNHTCEALQTIVHGAPGHELHARSLILYGRTLMDLGNFREASHQLRRAAGARHLPEDQARAAVFLAMAELFDDRPYLAADALFEHRLQFQDRTVRNAASLMTSIARWRTATGNSQEREAAFLYRAVAAVESQSDWLGPTGQLLLGQAMCEVDLEEKMVELFTRVLGDGAPARVELEMKLCLADYWANHEQTAQAKGTWTEIYIAAGPRSYVAGIRLAALALEERDPKTCLQLCQSLQHVPGISRPELLNLAGRAYEQSGNPLQAANCYAGLWPLP